MFRKQDLFNYQQAAVNFLTKPFRNNQKGYILADSPGLGKTRTAIFSCLELYKQKLLKVLIVCPASLKFMWEKEINFIDTDIKLEARVFGKEFKKPHKNKRLGIDFSIINYDNLQKHLSLITEEEWDILILDESHYIKNGKKSKRRGKEPSWSVKRTDACMKIGEKSNLIFLLSGTPITSRPLDFWNQLEIIKHPITKNNWHYYVKRYCDARMTRFGLDCKGASNLEELYEKTKDSILRRTKEEVLKDLPEKIRSQVPVEINLSEYQKAVKEYKDSKQKSIDSLGLLQKLKQITGKLKTKHTLEFISDLIENGESVIISSCFTSCLDEIQLELKKNKIEFVRVDGSTTAKNRQKFVDDFQNSMNPMVFLGQIQAAGVGLTLTKASHIIFNDLDWTPGNIEQMENRNHRIGVKHTCNILYLVAKNTLDEQLCPMLIRKLENINKIIDGQEITEDSIIKSLIKSLAV